MRKVGITEYREDATHVRVEPISYVVRYGTYQSIICGLVYLPFDGLDHQTYARFCSESFSSPGSSIESNPVRLEIGLLFWSALPVASG